MATDVIDGTMFSWLSRPKQPTGGILAGTRMTTME
jgi:hypothetical protein